MYLVSNREAAKNASKALRQTRDIVQSAGEKLYDAGLGLAQQMSNYYPRVRENLPDAHDVSHRIYGLLSTFLNGTRFAYGRVGYNLGYGLRRFEKLSLKLGLLYAIAKIYGERHPKLIEAQETVKAQINKKPVESAFIALGVGYVLGKLFRL